MMAMVLAAVVLTASAQAPVIDPPVWKQMPPQTIITAYTPRGRHAGYEGRIGVTCRIRDKSGRVACIVTGMSPVDSRWGTMVRRAMDAGARVDMRRTAGARPGRLVHMVWRFESDEPAWP